MFIYERDRFQLTGFGSWVVTNVASCLTAGYSGPQFPYHHPAAPRGVDVRLELCYSEPEAAPKYHRFHHHRAAPFVF